MNSGIELANHSTEGTGVSERQDRGEVGGAGSREEFSIKAEVTLTPSLRISGEAGVPRWALGSGS